MAWPSGQQHSEATRQKMRAAHKRRRESADYKPYRHSEQTLEKMRRAQRERLEART